MTSLNQPTHVDLVAGMQPLAQGSAGDAASPAALRKLQRSLAGRGRSHVRTQAKVIERLNACLAALRTGDYDAAGRRALDALKLDERHGLAWHLLAIAREKSGDLGQALNAYEAALKLLPDETDVAHDLGRLAQRLGYLEIAEKLLHKYLAAHPGHVEATNNLACVLRDQQRYPDAIDLLRDLIQVEPESPVLWNTLGTVLSDQGDMKGSLVFFEETLRLQPDFAKAKYNRGNARATLGEEDAALEDLTQAAAGAETPYEAAMMRMARAMLLMAMGRLAEGFAEYEARLSPDLPDAMRVVVDAPRFTGSVADLKGKRILVVGEQGIADEMVFGTPLADLMEAVGPEGQVFLAVEPRLVGLFSRAFPQAHVGGHKAVRLEGRLTRFAPFMEEWSEGSGRKADGWLPMAALLGLFRPTVDSFPDQGGYLAADPERVARWRRELEALGSGLKIGLHWKSLVLTGVRARYFSHFERWSPVLTTPGCVMVNLQCGDVADDLAQAEAAGVRIWTPPIDLKNDLEDVAALSVACDLVIGPGIAGTNLAAAVGARTWMIHAPDDWHLMSTDRYPMYPRMRCFATGGFDGWPGAIGRVREALDEAVRNGFSDAA
jgi:tetratricopeptide (TPR) repeat protein